MPWGVLNRGVLNSTGKVSFQCSVFSFQLGPPEGGTPARVFGNWVVGYQWADAHRSPLGMPGFSLVGALGLVGGESRLGA